MMNDATATPEAVVEAAQITASSPSEKGPMYDPARDKVYRHPTFYDIPDEVGKM